MPPLPSEWNEQQQTGLTREDELDLGLKPSSRDRQNLAWVLDVPPDQDPKLRSEGMKTVIG